jgi:hypothetical protein
MYGPLSAKQAREDAKFTAEQARKDIELRQKLQQKQELHQVKLAEQVSKAKAKGMKMPEVPAPRGFAMGKPTNPEAGPSDTIPAMLAPGEAVIPAPAAQDPKNKPVIKQLVNEGRQKLKGYEQGTTRISPANSGIDFSRMNEEERKYFEAMLNNVPKPVAGGTQAVPVPKGIDMAVPTPSVQQARENLFGDVLSIPYSVKEDPDFQRLPEDEQARILAGQYNRGSVIPAGNASVEPPKPNSFQIPPKQDSSGNWGPTTAGLRKTMDRYSDTVANQSISDLENINAQLASPDGLSARDIQWLQSQKARLEAELSGQPAPPPLPGQTPGGATISVSNKVGVPPPPQALNPITEKPINKPEPVVEVIVDGKPVEATPSQLERVNQFESILANSYTPESFVELEDAAAKLKAVAAQYPADSKERAEAEFSFVEWVKGAFQDMFQGDNPLFTQRELARFALTFAGGLLTGGSVQGSLRWSGLDVLKQIDGRTAEFEKQKQAAEAAQAARQVKLSDEQKVLVRNLSNRAQDAIADMDLPPAQKEVLIRNMRNELLSNPALLTNPAAAEAWLNQNIDTFKAYKRGPASSQPKWEQGVDLAGNNLMYRVDGTTGNIETRDSKGNVKTTPPGSVMSASDAATIRKSIQSRVASVAESRLDEKTKNWAPTLGTAFQAAYQKLTREGLQGENVDIFADAVFTEVGPPRRKENVDQYKARVQHTMLTRLVYQQNSSYGQLFNPYVKGDKVDPQQFNSSQARVFSEVSNRPENVSLDQAINDLAKQVETAYANPETKRKIDIILENSPGYSITGAYLKLKQQGK